MAPTSKSSRLLERADAALMSAIELYNKPDSFYREEAFSILSLNAWELLLKAKLLHECANDVRCLYEYERRRTKSGAWSQRQYVKRNRAGNVHTVGLGESILRLEGEGIVVPPSVRVNLDALAEIRDNAVHFVNAGPNLERLVLEVGTACVRNFIELARRWFGHDLSRYSLYLMPIGLLSVPVAGAVLASGEEDHLVEYLEQLVRSVGTEDQDFHVVLQVEVSMRRVAGALAGVTVTTNADAPQVQLTEEDIRQTFPWEYGDLVNRLRARYVDFKANEKFHGIRRPLVDDASLVRTRLLDPGNPRSARKDFYNPNIVRRFDPHYVRPEE
jgi:hypothetical protein